jgi:hypothetical protein
MTEDKAKMAAKIQALLAKAASTEHEAEAEAFMRKAQKLLEEHQINLGEFINADDPVIIDENGFEQTDSSPSWYKDLYMAVGGLYGCRAVLAPKILKTSRGNERWGYAIELVGRQSAITTAQLMFPWIKQQCFEKGRQIWRDAVREQCLELGLTPPTKFNTKEDANQEKKQARRVGNALVQRIWKLVREQEGQDPSTAAGKNALITLDRVATIYDDYTKDMDEMKNMPTVSNRQARDAANSIGLHRQTGSSSNLQIGSN